MKPKNDTERRMLALAEKLPPVTEQQRKWAFANCFEPLAAYNRRKYEVRCQCCGYTTKWDKTFLASFIDVDQYDCPECGRSMRLADYKTVAPIEHQLFTVFTTFRGLQVARTFDAYRDNSQPGNTTYGIDEVFQTWLSDDGVETITGRQLHRSIYSQRWDFHKPLNIRHHNASCTGQYAIDDSYDLTVSYIYPDIRVTPLIRRNGWSNNLRSFCRRISLMDAMRWLLTVPTAEMLVKTGQLDLFCNMVRRRQTSIKYLHSVRITNRRHYIVEDAQMWLDMLQMADDLGLDTHNPDVVCPPDLYAAHDHVRARLARLRRKQESEERRRQAILSEEGYRKSKGRYFGICFGNDDVIISVLTSVADIAEEGKVMHHCVFEAGYHYKPHSLILSARDSDGNRLETIEVNLRTFTVEQSRARCNGTSPRHDEILDLMRRNMHLIRAAAAS